MDMAASEMQLSVEELNLNEQVWVDLHLTHRSVPFFSNIFNKIANHSIPAINLWRKLQSLATYSQDTLVAEVQRLARFAPESLKKELDPKLHAPIHRLPDDILSDIFLLGLQDAHADDEDFEKPQHYQGLISLVCRRWKVVIEGTPLAWANITVLDRQPFTITKRFLRLSGTCLINIAINWCIFPVKGEGDTLDAYTVDEMSRLFRLLRAEAHRWRSFSVAVEDYFIILYVVQELQRVAVPNLRMLWLSHHDDEDSKDLTPPGMLVKYKLFQIPPGAPLLRDITLWGTPVDWSSPFLSSNLRKLALCHHHDHLRPEPQRFFEILSSSSETLEELTLESSGPIINGVDWEQFVSSKIELPNLHTLKVAFVSAEYARRMLDIIVARGVKELTLDFDDFEISPLEWNEFIKQLCIGGIYSQEMMFPALTSLGLLSLPAFPIYLGTLLYFHPQITSLIINFNYVDEDLLATLAAPISKIRVPPSLLPEWAATLHSEVSQYQDKFRTTDKTMDESVRRKMWVCPELRKLKVYGVCGEQLIPVVEGRKEGGVPLKEVWYADTCTLKMSDRAWLKANLEVFEEFEDDEDEDMEDDEDDEDD